MFTALLDLSAVAKPSARLLLNLAVEALYRPIWSQAILDELIEAEAEKRIKHGAEPDQAHYGVPTPGGPDELGFRRLLRPGWEPLVGSYRLPDPDDEHLVAAAVVGGAQASCGRPLRQPAASIAAWRSMR